MGEDTLNARLVEVSLVQAASRGRCGEYLPWVFLSLGRNFGGDSGLGQCNPTDASKGFGDGPDISTPTSSFVVRDLKNATMLSRSVMCDSGHSPPGDPIPREGAEINRSCCFRPHDSGARHVDSQVMGFGVRVRYATWVELVVIWLLVPNSSFLGHLSGILAGVLFTEMPVLLPFLRLIPSMIGIQSRRPQTYGYGTVGGGGQAHGGPASRAGASSGAYSSAPDARARASYDKAAAAEERDIGEALRRSMADARAEVRFAPRDEGLRGDSGGERQCDVGDDTPSVAPSAPRLDDLVHDDDYGSANGLRARRIPSSVEL